MNKERRYISYATYSSVNNIFQKRKPRIHDAREL